MISPSSKRKTRRSTNARNVRRYYPYWHAVHRPFYISICISTLPTLLYIYIYIQQRRQSRDTNRNIKRSLYCMPILIVYSLTFRALSLRQREKPDEGPMTETLDYTIRIGSTPTFIYTHIYIYIYG